jgi:hypothetical protein
MLVKIYTSQRSLLHSLYQVVMLNTFFDNYLLFIFKLCIKHGLSEHMLEYVAKCDEAADSMKN